MDKTSRKRFGLIGHPIGHSLSPALFRAGYEGRYTYDLIESEDFDTAFGTFIRGYDGINVTAPFKEDAFRRADILSEECIMIKAANMLVKTPEGVKAYNSDFLGMRRWLEEQTGLCAERTRDDISVLVVGIGGAGKAAAAAAASLGRKTTVMNRTMAKAEEWAEGQEGCRLAVKPLDDFAEEFRSNDIVIYTLPEAIPQIGDLNEDEIRAKTSLMEANYRNPVLRDNGRIWLLYQAATGYEIFTGEKPDFRQMSDVL